LKNTEGWKKQIHWSTVLEPEHLAVTAKKPETSALLSPLPSSRGEGRLVAGVRRPRYPRHAPPARSNPGHPTAPFHASVAPLAVVTLPRCAVGMVSLWDSLKGPARGKVLWKSNDYCFFPRKMNKLYHSRVSSVHVKTRLL